MEIFFSVFTIKKSLLHDKIGACKEWGKREALKRVKRYKLQIASLSEFNAFN